MILWCFLIPTVYSGLDILFGSQIELRVKSHSVGVEWLCPVLLDLPPQLTRLKITRSSICRVNTIISVHVHIGVPAAHGCNHRSQISPPTRIPNIGIGYRTLHHEHIHRSAARRHWPIERDTNGAIFPNWGTVDVGGHDILDVNTTLLIPEGA
jgi:hypothetical protein